MLNQKVNPLDILCPLHFSLGWNGKINHVGPALKRLGLEDIVGQDFFDVFVLTRPANITDIDAFNEFSDTRIQLQLKADAFTPFKASLARGRHGQIINLSFGIGVVEAVAKFGLTNADFAATDLTIELLYILEAKAAAMEESKNLNRRLEASRSEAEIQAQTDALTGLKNRRAMSHALQDLVGNRTPFACMHLDLDYFKAVNDSFGHAAGDHILVEVARILNEETRKEDCVARVGGDEFVLLFQGITDANTLDKIAHRIISKLEVPVKFENHICNISGSAGTTISLDYIKPDPDEILSDADAALYASKDAGRGCHTFFEDLREGARAN